MTAIEALELSIILWRWLVLHPDKYKDDCTLFDTTEYDCECPLCHYSRVEIKDKDVSFPCVLCPMYNRWPSPVVNKYDDLCIRNGAYSGWNEVGALLYDREFFATLIVLAFQKRLEELEHGKS